MIRWFNNGLLSLKTKYLVSARQRRKLKLVMTLLVRDEEDLVGANIDYHLSRGVDFIVATDNGSVDGTVDILREYETRGILKLIIEKEQDFSQSKWVNRMGMIAYEEFGAEAIFHCDADEFWWPASGSLKSELIARPDTDVLGVRTVNMILPRSGGRESFFDMKYAVVNPMTGSNVPEESRTTSLFLFAFPGKVIYSTRKGYLHVNQGNHSVVHTGIDYVPGLSLDMCIVHYPIRSYEHFRRKVLNGASAYNRNVGGWQWRRWYEAYLAGKIEDEYCVLTLDDAGITAGLDRRILEDWSTQHDAICAFFRREAS